MSTACGRELWPETVGRGKEFAPKKSGEGGVNWREPKKPA